MNLPALSSSPPTPTLLGRGPMRIPTGGKIRAGIKILTKSAANHPKAREIYDRGVLANKSFEDIEREIQAAVPDIRHPLVPKNVPWFSVRPQDFAHPGVAAQIMERFAEDRGDGVQRLYRFPVVFPADAWQAVMPHQLVAWGANERRYWSEYSPDGRERYCKCHAPVAVDPATRRPIRTFGGRKVVLRTENEGICDPERCGEYQNRQCNLSGRFLFFIPGIASLQAFELATNSFYAMNAAIQHFETVAFMRGGRISGFLDMKRTPFFISKRLMEVPHIDAEGRAVRVTHWIIDLEAPVDVTALLRDSDDDAVGSQAAQAAAVLQGPSGRTSVSDAAEGPAAALADGLPPMTTETASPEEGAGIRGEAASPPADDLGNERSYVRAKVERAPVASSGPSLDDVLAVATSFGITADRYNQFAAKRWGEGWKLNSGGRRRALAELEEYAPDPDRFLDRIAAELDTFA